MQKMTKEAVRAWQAGWRRVNAVTDAEARALSPAQRLARLEILCSFAAQYGLRAADEHVSDAEAWRRWQRLRAHYAENGGGVGL